VADFYDARDRTIPPLPWPSIAPPITGVTVEQLTARLALIGVDMSSGGVANKISRGGFSSAFLLQCMDALVSLPH